MAITILSLRRRRKTQKIPATNTERRAKKRLPLQAKPKV